MVTSKDLSHTQYHIKGFFFSLRRLRPPPLCQKALGRTLTMPPPLTTDGDKPRPPCPVVSRVLVLSQLLAARVESGFQLSLVWGSPPEICS